MNRTHGTKPEQSEMFHPDEDDEPADVTEARRSDGIEWDDAGACAELDRFMRPVNAAWDGSVSPWFSDKLLYWSKIYAKGMGKAPPTDAYLRSYVLDYVERTKKKPNVKGGTKRTGARDR